MEKKGNLKITKEGWKYGAWAGLHVSACVFVGGGGEGEGAGWLQLNLFSFSSRFINFMFRDYFTLCKIVLCIWKKIFFSCYHNFM